MQVERAFERRDVRQNRTLLILRDRRPAQTRDDVGCQLLAEKPRLLHNRDIVAGRGEQPADKQRGQNADGNGQHAIGAQGQHMLRMGRVEQGHHGRRIAGEHGGIGGVATDKIAGKGAQADPERDADDEHHGVAVRDTHQGQSEQHADDGAGEPGRALLQKMSAERLRGRPHRHPRPLRMLQSRQPGKQERKTCGERGPKAECEAGPFEAEPRSGWRIHSLPSPSMSRCSIRSNMSSVACRRVSSMSRSIALSASRSTR